MDKPWSWDWRREEGEENEMEREREREMGREDSGRERESRVLDLPDLLKQPLGEKMM